MRKIKRWFKTYYEKENRYEEFPNNVFIAELSFEDLDLSQFAILH